MLSFLYTHFKKHKPSLITISGAAGSSIGFLWGFDIQKLTPSGTLSPELMWQLRMFLTPTIISLYFLTLAILTLYHYKKDMEPITITPEDRVRFLKALNHDKEEIEHLKKELTLHKKYLKQYAPPDFDIDRAEEYEKGWNNSDKSRDAVNGTTVSTNKPTFSNNLLWLPDDPNPLCPRCYEVDSKSIHMKLKTYLTRPARYYCTGCMFATPHAEHPELKSTTNEWSSYVPATAISGFVYFKNTATPSIFACAVCKGKEQHPMILQPIKNAHTPGSYKCGNCNTWGVIP